MSIGKLGFPDHYQELKELGYPDHQIAKKLGYTYRSFDRQMRRTGITPSTLLQQLAKEERP